MNEGLKKAIFECIHANKKLYLEESSLILDAIEPLIDYDYQELRNYSESMKAQSEEYELEVRRLKEELATIKGAIMKNDITVEHRADGSYAVFRTVDLLGNQDASNQSNKSATNGSSSKP
jgi:hypothetical protein